MVVHLQYNEYSKLEQIELFSIKLEGLNLERLNNYIPNLEGWWGPTPKKCKLAPIGSGHDGNSFYMRILSEHFLLKLYQS